MFPATLRAGAVLIGALLAGALLVGALLALPVPTAQAVILRVHGHLVGVQLGAGPGAAGQAAAGTQFMAQGLGDNGDVDYNGGPVLHSSDPFLVFWDPSGTGIPAPARNLLEQYLTDVATDSGEADDVYGVAREYTDATGFAGGEQTFSAATQAISDTQPYPADGDSAACPEAPAYPICLTDPQIQAELTRLLSADGLPSDGPTGESEMPAGAPVYFVVTPSTVNVCLQTGDCSAAGRFCSYHAFYADGASNVIYAAAPFQALSQSPKNCQSDQSSALQEPNGDLADIELDDISHEDNESITDPLLSAWFDDANPNPQQHQEIADDCEAYSAVADPANGLDPNAYGALGGDPTPVAPASYGTLYDQLINGDRYYTQTVWSDGDVNCEAQPSTDTIADRFSAAALPPPAIGASFDPSASQASSGFSSATWSFGDGQTSFQTWSLGGSQPSFFATGEPSATAHTYAQPGTYTVTLTLVDAQGNLATTSHAVVVVAPLTVLDKPTAAFVVSPAHAAAGSAVLFDGAKSTDAGASIVSYSWSFGDGATGSGVTAAHTYAKPGDYPVTLTVTDTRALTASTTAAVPVRAAGRITRISVKTLRGKEILEVSVSAPGEVRFGSKTLTLKRAGVATFRLTLAAAQRQRLAEHRRISLRLTVVYVPLAGPRIRKTQTVTVSD